MEHSYDVIVVGARCAGSPTAMLLARKGYRVLLVDRSTFPSDTLSTHVIQPTGVAALARWGLREALVASGCPPIHTYAFDFGPLTIAGAPGSGNSKVAYCPRRTVLDKMLVDAAANAGVEVREGFSVEQIVIEDGRVIGVSGRDETGISQEARAPVVVGADGRNSIVARAVGAEEYNVSPPLLSAYYSYWSGLPTNGQMEFYIRPRRGFGGAETHDGLTMIIAGWPIAEFEANQANVESHYLATLRMVPEFAARLATAKRETRLRGAVMTNFFRKPYGPGWALVGDAAYHKDSITAQGITDAFLEAEQCAAALDAALNGTQLYNEALGAYHLARDARVMPMYELTCQLAALEPPPAEMQALLSAIHRRQSSMDAFAQMNAGTISPAEFFAAENVASLMAAA